jgi:hypothetical protein
MTLASLLSALGAVGDAGFSLGTSVSPARWFECPPGCLSFSDPIKVES